MRLTLARFLVGLAALFVTQFRAEAQGQQRLPHVGWLQNNSADFPPYEGFREGMRQLGYSDGVNIVVMTRSADGDHDRLPKFAGELVQSGVQVLLVGGDQGLQAAKQATDTVPIVVLACDPLHQLVQSLSHPRGGATGLTCISSDLVGKRLQLLKDLVPGVSRVAVLYNPKDVNKVAEYTQAREAARLLGIALQPFEAGRPSQFAPAFASMKAADAQALLVLADPLMNFHVQMFANLASKERLPAIYGFREFPRAGGLASYGANLREEYRRAAWYIDRILKGAAPHDLPVQEPTTFEFILNLKTAKALGIEVPPTLLARADEVIE
jgi:putative tryptophan/tyrosine transport system substrate-binding protein